MLGTIKQVSRQKQLYHLRRALSVMVPDAATRFAFLFRTSHRPRNGMEVQFSVVVPHEVWCVGESSPLWDLYHRLFVMLRRRTHMNSALSLRKALSFLHGFLFACGAHSLVPRELQTDRASVEGRLQALTRADVIVGYQAYHDHGGRVRRVVTLPCLSRHLFLISVLFCDILRSFPERITPEVFGLARRRRAPAAPVLDESTASLDSWESREVCRMQEEWIHTKDYSGTDRHIFTADEVRRLYLACATLFERIVFVALFTTGMRIGGLCRLEADGVYANADVVSTSVWTREKGGRRMEYPLNDVLAELLRQWKPQSSSVYLFPSERGGHVSTNGVRKCFGAVARRAGVCGRHVHPHTTRHTRVSLEES